MQYSKSISLSDGPRLPYQGGRVRYTGSPNWVTRRAPAFAEHNSYVLGDILGLTETQLQELRGLEIIRDSLPER